MTCVNKLLGVHGGHNTSWGEWIRTGLIVMLWDSSFIVGFVCFSVGFSLLVCCHLEIGTLDIMLLMNLIVLLKFI